MLSVFLQRVPFPWQQRLFHQFIEGNIPSALDLPTGTGKTSVISIWLAALATQAQQGTITLPRRLVYIVNRRTIVDQATAEVEGLLKHRLQLPALKQAYAALEKLAALPADNPVAASTLRGELADNGEWKADPARPAIILGTVDMVLSKLLFRGYGDGKRKRVIHAGLLGHETLLVHDESHLVPAACNTLHRLVSMNPAMRLIDLSATQRGNTGNTFQLDSADLSDPVLIQRIQAHKHLKLLSPVKDEKLRLQKIVECALTHQDTASTVVIFLRDIKSVTAVHEQLHKQVGGKGKNNILILTGRLRGYERDQLVQTELWKRFSPDYKPADKPTQTVYLITTSAGEVGVDLDAEYAVADLTELDSMIQRFGRVNRRGESSVSQIDVVYSDKQLGDKHIGSMLQATLDCLKTLDGDASPANLARLVKPAAAFPAEPASPELDAWIMDELSATSLSCRYPVRHFIHGLEAEQPTINLLWRKDLDRMQGWQAGDWVEDYLDLLPVHTTERVSLPINAVKDLLVERLSQSNRDTFQIMALGNDDAVWQTLQDTLTKLTDCHTLILPAKLGGLSPEGMPGVSYAEAVTDVLDVVTNVRRYWSDADAPTDAASFPREGRVNPPLAEDSDTERSALVVLSRVDLKQDKDWSYLAVTMGLQEHLDQAEGFARQISHALRLPDELAEALIIAASWHDKGKNRLCWQQAIGNKTPDNPLAKTGHGRYDHTRANGYRHEFGSLLDALEDDTIQQHPLRELILHLIVSHHGWGRPHVPERGWDRPTGYRINQQAALEVMNRFDRCQQDYGWWQLAWLEALLGAADVLASQGRQKA